MQARAVRIAQDLHLDVAGALDVALVHEPAVAEGRLGLARRGLDRLRQVAGLAHHAHAAAAAAGARLDQHGVADLVGVGAARHDGHARALGQLAGGVLAPERRERRRRCAHEHEPRGAAGLGQLGRLGEEAVAGMERLGPACRGGHGERGGVQVARHLDRGVGLALGDRAALVGRDERQAAHAELAARADDAHGDLAAAGHRHALERWTHQRGSRRSRNAAMPSRPSAEARRAAIASAARAACSAASPSRRPAISAFAARTASGPAAQHRGDDARDGLVERRVVGVHLVREPDPEGVLAADELAGEEQRAGLRATDARERERRDRRRDEAEPHLGEAEARVLAREHDVAAAGEAGAASERGAVDAPDDRHGAAVDGREHGRHALGVGDVLPVRQLAGRAHPVEIAAGAEGRAATREHDRAQRASPRPAPRTSRDTAAIRSASNALRRSGRSSHTRAMPSSRSTSTPLTCGTRRSAVRGSGACAAAARPSASTRRVSRGSITPSSHSRAVE